MEQADSTRITKTFIICACSARNLQSNIISAQHHTENQFAMALGGLLSGWLERKACKIHLKDTLPMPKNCMIGQRISKMINGSTTLCFVLNRITIKRQRNSKPDTTMLNIYQEHVLYMHSSQRAITQ